MCRLKAASIWLWSAVLTISFAGIALFILDPLWFRLGMHVPGEPYTPADVRQPVDSIFYVRNAQLGYRWTIEEPTSLWFHPLLSWIISWFPAIYSLDTWLWLISLVSTFGSLIVLHHITQTFSPEHSEARLLLLVPLVPGYLGMATGNAEIPCLLFNALLILSVLKNGAPYWACIWGVLSILTKPNALYMVGPLAVYAFAGARSKDRRRVFSSLLGIAGILLGWGAWMLFVDLQAGQLGTYLRVRELASVPRSHGFLSFLRRSVEVLLYHPHPQDRLRFATALAIPLVHLWILPLVQLSDEVHAFAVMAGILVMIFVTFVVNNPNKIIVYIATIPGYANIVVLFLRQSFRKIQPSEAILHYVLRYAVALVYLIFCFMMLIFYVIGTPLQWYY